MPYRREPASHGTGFRCTRVSARRTGSVPGPSRSVACGKVSSVAVMRLVRHVRWTFDRRGFHRRRLSVTRHTSDTTRPTITRTMDNVAATSHGPACISFIVRRRVIIDRFFGPVIGTHERDDSRYKTVALALAETCDFASLHFDELEFSPLTRVYSSERSFVSLKIER